MRIHDRTESQEQGKVKKKKKEEVEDRLERRKQIKEEKN
jgi:hypothetical protein